MLWIVVALAVLVSASSSLARTWTITPDGLGDAPTIQAGIDSASARDTVVVACGTYEEHEISLKPLIVLRSETGDPDCARIDAGGLGRVLVAMGVAPSAKIEGLTIEGGQGSAGTSNGGGGLHCTESELQISHCVFMGNTSPFGGGIGCYESSMNLENCRFEANAAEAVVWAAGGGIFCKNSSPVLQDCIFVSNTAFSTDLPGDGGGIFSHASTLEASNCNFLNNSSGAGGGGMYSFATDQPVLTQCTFTNNESAAGGGMYLETSFASLIDCNFAGNTAITGGAMMIAKWSAPQFEGCVLSENHSAPYSGGGISVWHSSPLFQNCSFLDNTAGLDGGAIFAGGVSSPTLQNCLVLRNVAANRGGAIRCYYATQVNVLESTLVGNGAPGGSISTEFSGPTTIGRSILAWGESGAAVVCVDASTIAFTCSDIFGNPGGDWTGCIAAQVGQEGNISADPLFCDLLGNDLELHPNSPCAPENSGSCGLIGALPAGCAAVSAPASIQPESWGGIKALYR